MQVLCDTNVLVRLAKPDDPDHGLALSALTRLTREKHRHVLVPQCLYEFYVVATRPVADNGLGLTAQKAVADIDRLMTIMALIDDTEGIFSKWKSTVDANQVLGKQSHDARLVAAMDHHGLTCLMTFNAKHFKRFGHLHVVTPDDVMKGKL